MYSIEQKKIQIFKTKLDGVLLIKPYVHEDHRGFYIETYNEKTYKEKDINIKFVEDDISVSTQNVIRGIHGDDKTWKLISCLYGKFYLVVINCNKKSKSFGQWQSFVLSDVNRLQVLVPPTYGNAHLILSQQAIFCYKQSEYYDPHRQFTFKWDDPQFKIWWPIRHPVLSQRDEMGKFII